MYTLAANPHTVERSESLDELLEIASSVLYTPPLVREQAREALATGTSYSWSYGFIDATITKDDT